MPSQVPQQHTTIILKEDVDMILLSMQPLDCEESFDDCRFEPSLIPYPFVSFE